MQKSSWNQLTFLIMSVYFVQGFVVITGLAEFFLTRNVFQFTWIQLALLSALGTLTWSVKPIYGFLTDLLPLFGLRRKSYLILSTFFPILGFLALTFYGTSFLPIALSLIFANIGLGLADVIADGLVVERATKENIGWYQALSWRSKAVGIFFSTLFAGMILERGIFSKLLEDTSLAHWLTQQFPKAFPYETVLPNISMIDIRFTFLIAAILPLLTLITAFLLKEKKADKQTLKTAQKDIPLSYIASAGVAFGLTAIILIFLPSKETAILSFLTNSALASILVMIIWGIWMIWYCYHLIKLKAATMTLIYAALFIFLWRFTPSFGAPWSNYWYNTLALPQEMVSFVSTLQPLAWVIGSFIYVHFFDKTPIKKLLLWTVIIASGLGLTELLAASPELGNVIGENIIIKHLSVILLTPTYFIVHGFDAWKEILAQAPILHLAGLLTFLNEMMFIIAFLPLLKLAALVTPKGVEATNFAVLASIMNLGLVFGSISGGIIYTAIEGSYIFLGLTITGLHITILIGALTSLICLAILPKLKV